ncbi:MAG: squalene/phytoene synthase family protein [Phycisphaerae bacterium]|nr:squalene/phytoene synthase family protein [Phycisphaerae bacterium]
MDAFIAKHLQGVSRTYAIVVPMLPEPLADAVGSAYLLMRIVDTLEDAPQLTTDERVGHLAHLDAALSGDDEAVAALAVPIGDLEAEHDLMQAAPEVFRKVQALEPAYREAARECARAMSAGVCKLITRSTERDRPYPAIRDAAELHEYCYYVAGTVGEMLCAMMAHYLKLPALKHLRELAVELGVGLQLVNILKDAFKDSHQGRRYLPAVEDGQVSHAEIYKAALNEARQSLQRGIDFVLALPASARELRSFCGLPIAWGAMTLAQAERDAGGAKIGRGAIRSSIELFNKLAGDDQALRDWLSSLLWSPGRRGRRCG